MKAIGYLQAHPLEQFSLREFQLPEPEMKPGDLRVRIKAISVNPVDYKIRKNRSATGDRPVILGWDAAGVVEKAGSEAKGFQVGDEVYYAGDLLRDGSSAELQAVDARLVAKKPRALSFAEAAALPLTALTAWEALFEKGIEYGPETKVLIIGGAGGVGSLAIPFLREKTKARVFATASRPESAEWCRKLGAEAVLDHSKNLLEEMKNQKLTDFDLIFSTNHTDKYLPLIPQMLRPFGHLAVIDDPGTLDIMPFKSKALSVHWEFMFAKSMHKHAEASQGRILAEVAKLVNEGKISSSVQRVLKGLNAENVKTAHTQLEQGRAIGKIVIEF